MFRRTKNSSQPEANEKALPSPVASGYRNVPACHEDINEDLIEELSAIEWARFRKNNRGSENHNDRASTTLPLGVTSSFQHWDPYPISIVSGKGAYLKNVDGQELLDLSMGFGAVLTGHLNPRIVKAVKQALKRTGTLFVTPSVISTESAERLKARFELDMVRFTNSGTESTMYAIRTARAVTGKNDVVKIEGGYHGGYDPLQVSVKPSLSQIGKATNPKPHYPSDIEGGTVHVAPYNNLTVLGEIFRRHANKIGCLIIEPVVENLSIILPDEGYLEGVRDLCNTYKVALIFDEVKTGLTAGYAGAAKRIGVKPDLICLAKSIGGGMPIAAFGGTLKYMSAVVDGRMPHFGTYNGNPISCAAVIAVDDIATSAALAKAEEINVETLSKLDKIIDKYKLPAHTVGFGVKGAVIWKPQPVRNYRDFKETNFALAELSWLWCMNRGIITPPGLDEQWLVSLMTTQKDMDKLVEAMEELAIALTHEK